MSIKKRNAAATHELAAVTWSLTVLRLKTSDATGRQGGGGADAHEMRHHALLFTCTSSISNLSTLHGGIVTPLSQAAALGVRQTAHMRRCRGTAELHSTAAARAIAPCLVPWYASCGGTTTSQCAPSCIDCIAAPRPCSSALQRYFHLVRRWHEPALSCEAPACNRLRRRCERCR